MKKYLSILVCGIIAGMFIGLGVTVFLFTMTTSKIVASLLFGFGLYCVIVFNAFLYTGKVGFVLDNKPNYFLDLLVGLVGNFIGIIGLCFLISLTRAGATLQENALALVNTKQNDSWYSILLLSIFCGFMIYLAVVGHKKVENPFGRVLICFLAVSIFILCGFEHCIANAGYYTYAHYFDLKSLLYFVLMIVGNGIGSIILDAIFKLYNKLTSK